MKTPELQARGFRKGDGVWGGLVTALWVLALIVFFRFLVEDSSVIVFAWPALFLSAGEDHCPIKSARTRLGSKGLLAFHGLNLLNRYHSPQL